MSDEVDFLIYIYNLAKVGQETVGNIIKNIKKENINDEIYNYFNEQIDLYKKISTSARSMIKRRKKDIEDIGLLSKIATYVSVKRNVTKSNDISEFAKILIQGSKITITQINEKIEDYKLKNKNIINLTNRLINIEENNINYLRKYVNDKD